MTTVKTLGPVYMLAVSNSDQNLRDQAFPEVTGVMAVYLM